MPEVVGKDCSSLLAGGLTTFFRNLFGDRTRTLLRHLFMSDEQFALGINRLAEREMRRVDDQIIAATSQFVIGDPIYIRHSADHTIWWVQLKSGIFEVRFRHTLHGRPSLIVSGERGTVSPKNSVQQALQQVQMEFPEFKVTVAESAGGHVQIQWERAHIPALRRLIRLIP